MTCTSARTALAVIPILLLSFLGRGIHDRALAGSQPALAQEIALSLDFQPGDLTITVEGDEHVIRLEGAATPELAAEEEFGDPGSPALPLLRVPVLLPEGAAVTGVSIASPDEPWMLAGPYLPRPLGDGAATAEASTAPLAEPDPSIYNSFAPYPEELVAGAQTGTMRGYVIGTVEVTPVQYVGATGVLLLHRHLDIRVRYGTAPPEMAEGIRHRAPNRERDTAEGRELAWLRSFVANPGDLDRFYGGGASANFLTGASRPFAGFVPTPFPSTDGPPVEYVIITDSLAVDGRPVGNLVAEFQRLADWKTRKGTPAVVRTVSWIREHYAGHDDPARIRAFLIEAYELWGTDYVLLGGDVGIVPGRRFNGLNLGAGHPPADVYYGGLDQSWDLDRDGVYGEFTTDAAASDPYWDVWVGRAPVENAAEAAILVERTLAYARAPGSDLTGLEPDYYERVLLLDGLANCPTWGQGCNGIYVGEVIARRILTPNIERTRMYQRLLDPSPSCLYHETYVETVDSTQVLWTTSAALAALNAGVGFLQHFEHSNPYEEGGASDDYGCAASTGGAIGREYVDQLTNKPNWSIIYSTGAGVNAFDYESVSEHWVLNPNGGAAAYIGKTRSGSITFTTGEVDTLLFANIFTDGMTIGQAMAIATGAVSITPIRAVSSFGLLGDPELKPWTAAPATLDLTLSPQSFPLGEHFFEVTVRDAGTQSPVGGARVAVMQGDRTYAYALTAGDGVARFGLTLLTRDDLEVTVTAPNYAPGVAVATADPLDAVQVAYESHTVADDSTAVANSNGIADAGEVLKVDIAVENTGLTAVTGVTGELTAIGEVTLAASVDGQCDPDRIYAGALDGHPTSGAGEGECALRFPEDEFRGLSPRGRPSTLIHTAEPGLFVWRQGNEWHLVARGPDPVPTGMRFVGSLRIPGNHEMAAAGALEPGDQWSVAGPDSIEFDFTAQAAGDLDSLVFVAREPLWVAIPAASAGFGDLAPGAIASNRFLVALTNRIPDRHEPRLELELRDGGAVEVGRSSMSLPAAAPALSYAMQTAEQNGDDWTIAPVIRNDGNGVADQVTAILRLESGAATVTDSVVSFGSIAGGGVEAGAGPDLFAFSTTDPANVRFQVVIENSYPDGSVGSWTKAAIDIVAPCPPTDLAARATHGRSARLSWTAPDGTCAPDLAGYAIYRQLLGESSFTRVTMSDSTMSFQDVMISPDTTFVYAVAARDSSGNESPWTDPVTAGTWLAEHPGWPKQVNAGTASSPLVIDVDGDGRLEIFVLGNSLYAWHADGTPVVSGNADGTFFAPPRPPERMILGAAGAFHASPAAADLDRNGSLEIAITAWDDSLWVLEAATGELLWGRHLVPKFSSPALGDLDGDGDLEVIVGSDADTVYAWHHDGSPVNPAYPSGAFAPLPDGARINYTTPALADIDADPQTVEVIYATFKGDVYAWDGTAALLWSVDLGYDNPASTPALGDVDSDGIIEAVVAQGTVNVAGANALFIIDTESGTIEQSWAGSAMIPGDVFSNGNIIHPPSLADLDGNGDLEIVLGTSGVTWPPPGTRLLGGATVLVFDHQSTGGFLAACRDEVPTPGHNMTNVSRETVNAQPIIANLDGDAGLEIGAGSTTFGLFLFEAAADVQGCEGELGWPLLFHGEVDATPFVGDVDRDGEFDLVTRSHDGEVHIFRVGTIYDGRAVQWGQYLHDPRHTSYYIPPGANPVPPSPAPVPAFVLTQNRPNPFRPPTRIQYALPAGGRARLEIYAADGRLVRVLVDRSQEAGPHEVSWDGRDTRGFEVPAGVYFYRLTSAGRTASRKLLLIR